MREHGKIRRPLQVLRKPFQSCLTITPKLLGSKPGFVVLYRHSLHLADESRDIGRHSAAGENAGLKTYLEVRFFVHVDAVDESHLACAARHHE